MMKLAISYSLASCALLLSACNQATNSTATSDQADGDIARPADQPTVATSENLMRITCADYLAAAEIATAQPADDAALAAQDEIANGLTWLHGYLYGANNGEVEPLSQDWMKATAARVFEACSESGNAAETNLFEVAIS